MKSTICQEVQPRKRIGAMVHLLVSQTQGMCSKPRRQSKGDIMCLLEDVVLVVQALYEKLLEEAAARSFLVGLARKITIHLTMKWPQSSFYCGGYSY